MISVGMLGWWAFAALAALGVWWAWHIDARRRRDIHAAICPLLDMLDEEWKETRKLQARIATADTLAEVRSFVQERFVKRMAARGVMPVIDLSAIRARRRQ